MKNVKIITIILAIILVTLVAFGGVYVKTQNRMENKVREYDLSRELKGERVIEVKVSDDEDKKSNPEDLTLENYETVKKTIENRLKAFGAQDYTISLNKEDGTIMVELPEDDNTDMYAYLLTANAKVQMKEKDTDTELLSDSMVKKALYTYTANSEGKYQAYLELHLTEEGQAKIEELQNNYAVLADEIEEIEAAQEKEETTEGEETAESDESLVVTTEDETTNENETNEEKQEETKKIAVLTVAESEYDIDKIEKNKIRVKIGGETSNSTSINNNISSAAELATLISAGRYPVEYEIGENRFVHSDITEKQLIYFAIAIAIVMLIVFIILTIKYKTRGLLSSISIVGFVSVLSLILRYTNVSISIEGLGAILLTIIINIRINQIMLRDENSVNYKELVLKLIPVVIVTLVFCFTQWSNLSSFGMIMFWGLVLIAGYNALVTRTLLKLKESK